MEGYGVDVVLGFVVSARQQFLTLSGRPITHVIDEATQLRRKIPPVRKVEEKAWEERVVLLQHGHQLSSLDIGPKRLLHAERQAASRAGGPHHGCAIIDAPSGPI